MEYFIFTVLGGYILHVCTSDIKKLKKIKLEKKNEYSISKFDKKLTKVLSEAEMEDIVSIHNNRFITNFVDVMKAKISPDNLNNFFMNLNNIRILDNDFIKFWTDFFGTAGFVISKNRKQELILNLGIDESPSIKYHELLHVASTRYDKVRKKFCSGFQHKNIGRGINEGYTTLLTKRFFSETSPRRNFFSYEVCKYFSSSLEIIVGKDNMQKLYFDADLNGLITNLSEYISRENAIELIQRIDLIIEYDYVVKDNKKILLETPYEKSMKKAWKQNIIQIAKILLEIRNIQLQQEYNNGKLSYETYKREMLIFGYYLVCNINAELKCYFPKQILDQIYMFEYIESVIPSKKNAR